jgi:protein-tyrosine-phosphatase
VRGGLVTVLFVCRMNAARSQLAEGLARSMAPSGTRILSAGLSAFSVLPEVRRALAELGIDASGQVSKPLEAVRAEAVDEVIVLDEAARDEVAAAFPFAPLRVWPIPDPTLVKDRALFPRAVREVRDELKRRIEAWLGERRGSGGGGIR